MLFVGLKAVCFVIFLPVDFLCCCYCINVLLFDACCNFGSVTGHGTNNVRTCHVTSVSMSQDLSISFKKATFPLDDKKWNKSDYIMVWLLIIVLNYMHYWRRCRLTEEKLQRQIETTAMRQTYSMHYCLVWRDLNKQNSFYTQYSHDIPNIFDVIINL